MNSANDDENNCDARKPEATLCEENDNTTTIEGSKEDFQNWKVESEKKIVSKKVIPSKVGKITNDMWNDDVVWNIFNLRGGNNTIYPDTKPTNSMVLKALQWSTIFRSYVLGVMKNWVVDEYIKIFNQPKWKCLQGNNEVLQWSELCLKLKDRVDEKV